MKNLRFWGIGLMALLLTGACAHQPSRTDTESALKDRVSAYWQHRIKGDLAEAYFFEHPAFREKASLTNYIRGLSSEGIILQKVDILKVNLDGDKATLRMTYTFRLLGIRSPRNGVPMKGLDFWKLKDGIWYRSREEKTEAPRTHSSDDLVY